MNRYKILLYTVTTLILVACCVTAIIALPVKLLVDIISLTTLAVVVGLVCEYIYNVVIKKGM